MNEWEQKPRRNSSCGTWVVGCLVVFVVLAGVGFFVLQPKLSKLMQGAKTGLQHVTALNALLSEKYQTPEVHVGFNYDNNGSTLKLEIVNSPLLRDLSAEQAAEEAKKVAQLARDTTKEKHYDHYQVVFEQRSNEAGGASQASQTFSFEAADLGDASVAPTP